MIEFLSKILYAVRLHEITMYGVDVKFFYEFMSVAFCIIIFLTSIFHLKDFFNDHNHSFSGVLLGIPAILIIDIAVEFLIFCILIQFPFMIFCTLYVVLYVFRALARLASFDKGHDTNNTAFNEMYSNIGEWFEDHFERTEENDNVEMLKNSYTQSYQDKINLKY